MTDFESLIRRAQDGDSDAAMQLSSDPDSLPAVLQALDGAKPVGLLPDVVVKMSGPAVAPVLIDGLASLSFDVRRACALALGRSRDPRALQALLAMLDDSSITQADRSFAAEALGELGAPSAIGPLQAVIAATRPDLAWNDWPVLLIRCAEALAKLGDHSAVDAVLEALGSEIETARSLAAGALRIVTGPHVVEALAERIRDKSREVRLAAIDPLFLIGAPAAVEALLPACGDNVDDIALRALQRLGDLLGESLGDSDGEPEARAAWERHRAAFREGICHRWGRPLRVADLADAWEADVDRRSDIAAELTIITGLPVSEIIDDGGVDRLRETIRAGGYIDGGLYKWGRRQQVP